MKSQKITIHKKNLGKYVSIDCYNKYCLDEIFGLIAIVCGIVAMVTQFIYTGKTFNIKSFSVIAIFFTFFAEAFFAVQGCIKRSWTIALTRIATTGYVFFLIVIWFIHRDDPEPPVGARGEIIVGGTEDGDNKNNKKSHIPDVMPQIHYHSIG